MKRIFLLMAMCFLVSAAIGQRVGQQTLTARYDLKSGSATDTILPVNGEFSHRDYNWRIDIMWDSVSGGLNSVLKVKTLNLPLEYQSDDAWLSYPGMDSVIMSTTTGYTSFEDYNLMSNKLGLFIDVVDDTSGVVRAWVTLKQKR